ncbi:MAG: GTPase [Thermoprotei archaeon]|nr:MAG: GTPase [Thermoprotei archaeon]
MRNSKATRVIIMGAAGRDFHNFNIFFRDNPEYEVVAFTASQIPNISNRTYPPELAGKFYPKGIPIYPEEHLEDLIKKYKIDEVVLAYSDLVSDEVLEKISKVLASGANFRILGIRDTMLKTEIPVIAVTASRTGAGKSTVSKKIARILRDKGVKFAVVRHPMPYGDLRKSVIQKFSKIEDLAFYGCTIEEREEYETHIAEGNVVYAGVDYEKILKDIEKEKYELILWDGGNNDWPFYKPNLYITVIDPLRPGHEIRSFPGLVNLLLADVVIVNKVNVANEESIKSVVSNVNKINKKAKIIMAASEVTADKPELLKGKRALIIEDGPTVTHGSLGYAAGYIAAKKYGAEIIDPRNYVFGSIKEIYDKYDHIGTVLPALGYGREQMKELEEIINKVPADVIVLGTPSDISKYLKINKPVVKVSYEIKEVNEPSLEDVIEDFLNNIKK